MIQNLKKIVFNPLYFAFIYAMVSAIFIIEAFTSKSLNYNFDFVTYGGTFAYVDLKILGLPAYWFLMLLGFAINFAVVYSRKEKYGFSTVKAIILPPAFLIVSFIGGKILYLIEHPTTGKAELGGLSLFGAIILVPIVATIVSLAFKTDVALLLDISAIQGLVLLVCVRTGCFISGCCGAQTIWMGERPIILPIQLIEVVFDLIVLYVCLCVERKVSVKGYLYPILLVGYGTVRFILEFFRKSALSSGVLNVSHILALFCATVGVICITLMCCLNKGNNK